MATLNLSYEDLASVVCLAVHLANADGNVADEEKAAILKAITDQYDFEGKQDLLQELLNDGIAMSPQVALQHISEFGAVEKQWTSNFFVKTIVADGNLEENEKSLYWDIQEKCGLPDHNLEGGSSSGAAAQNSDVQLDRQTCVTIGYRRVKDAVCDGEVSFVQYDRNVNVREKVFAWFQDAEALQFQRTSKNLDHINARLNLAGDWKLIMVYAAKDYWADPKLNRAGSVIAGGDVFGPVFFVLENKDKTLMGFNYKSFIKALLTELYALDNGMLVSGEDAPNLSGRYFLTALTALDALKGTEC